MGKRLPFRLRQGRRAKVLNWLSGVAVSGNDRRDQDRLRHGHIQPAARGASLSSSPPAGGRAACLESGRNLSQALSFHLEAGLVIYRIE
jgi:hypothetical protein